MMLALVLFVLYSICVTVAFVFSVKKNFTSDDKIDDLTEGYVEMDDQIDEALESIDECYGRIARASATPLMSDEPEVKELMSNLKHIKTTILDVANKLNTLGHANEEKNTRQT